MTDEEKIIGILNLIETKVANHHDEFIQMLECRLQLRAAVCGWTGDPLRQPVEVVAAAAIDVLCSCPWLITPFEGELT